VPFTEEDGLLVRVTDEELVSFAVRNGHEQSIIIHWTTMVIPEEDGLLARVTDEEIVPFTEEDGLLVRVTDEELVSFAVRNGHEQSIIIHWTTMVIPEEDGLLLFLEIGTIKNVFMRHLQRGRSTRYFNTCGN
jgi:hypothetical protein